MSFGEFDYGALSVCENVGHSEAGIPHRRKYGYQCNYRTDFLFRYDRDPVQHPDMPEHKHLPPDERRVHWDRVTSMDVAEEFSPIVSERDEAERDLLRDDEEGS